MNLAPQSLRSLSAGFQVVFNKAFAEAKPLWPAVATLVPSTAASEDYGWIGSFPRMREWLGDRVIRGLAAHAYEIKNRPWESTIGIDRDTIDDDRYGVYAPLISAMGQEAATHPDDLVFALMPLGFNALCYDGQYFFDTDHRDGEGPIQSNRSTAPLSAAAYAIGRAAMMGLLDENGKPLNIVPDKLVYGPALDATAREILLAERDANGKTNVLRGTAEPLCVPHLAAHPAAWFLLCTSRPIKPLIYQERKKPQFTMLTNPDDENVFMRKEYLYGVDSRDNAGFGLWQLAYGSTGTGA